MVTFLLLLLSFSDPQYSAPPPQQKMPPPPTSVACPWLTAGSAARVLGGDVSVTAEASNTEGACHFVRTDGTTNSLEIVVGMNSPAPCPAGSVKLVGIGNEATRCRIAASRGDTAEMISSRVRETHFAVILRVQKRTTKPSDPQNDALEQLGEQVAGNLF